MRETRKALSFLRAALLLRNRLGKSESEGRMMPTNAQRREILLLLLILLAPTSLGAQFPDLLPQTLTAPDSTTQPADTVPPAFPGSYEVVSRGLSLADTAAAAIGEVARIAALDPIIESVRRARVRERELLEQLTELQQEVHLRPEVVSQLHDQALTHNLRLDRTMERVGTRLQELGELRAEWLARRQFWTAWRDTLANEPEFAVLAPEIGRALARTDSVLARIADAAPALLQVQRELEQIRRENLQVVEQTEEIRTTRRAALFRQDAPTLFEAEFWAGWDGLAAWVREGTAKVEKVRPGWVRQRAGTLALHALFALVIALGVRQLRRGVAAEAAWVRMSRHPWAIGIFVATAMLARRYGVTPPLWDLGMWVLMAASGALLAHGMFANPRKRLIVYLLAAFYTLFLFLEVLSLPVPLFRLWLAAAAAAGAAGFAGLARRDRLAEAGRGFTAALWLGAGVWAVVFTAEVLGWDALARWVTTGAISSAFAVFVVSFVVLIARGMIATLLRTEPEGRFRFLRRVGYPLAERLVWLLQAVLIGTAALYVLDVWELIASPLNTWQTLLDAGFSVGALEITMGRVLFAALVLYLVWLASWVLKVFLQGEVFRRWELDPGVGDSITTLLTYVLVVVGVLVALGTLGFELKNFAIIVGALGVGIGFGLQNIVNNFFSGLILLFERPVRVGDTVVIGGEWGTIHKIGLRSTIVVTWDQAELIVPNADLISEKVTNWTLSSGITRLVLPVGVAYGSEVETVFRELAAAADGNPDVVEVPAPQALFTGFGESSLDFELRVWVRRVQARPLVRSALLAEIDRRFRAEGVEIPFPQRDLHLRSVDEDAVRAAAAKPVQNQGDGQAERF